MRVSKLLFKTYHEDPADAELRSHKLLARGGFIVKTGSGIYTLSPMMWRVVRKVMTIVCDEMDQAGAQEIMMPILQPFELWEESGRLPGYLQAKILFNLEDRKGAKLALGPTHEEVVSDYVRRSVTSHKDLPVMLYQQQMKFRDEIRPRFGLMRGREFMMKDCYSFDIDEAGLDVSYEKMRQAYHRIFQRVGLRYVVVDADSGAIGGSRSQEFMAVADAGEDELLLCEAANYGANIERAESVIDPPAKAGDEAPMRKVETPNIRTVDQLCDFFDLPATRTVKTIIYDAVYEEEVKPVAVLMRGDRQINEVKLVNHLGAIAVAPATDDRVRVITGAEPGFAGPVGLGDDVRVLADESVRDVRNFVCGANETDHHCVDVNTGRDFADPEWLDVRLAEAGDRCTLDAEQRLESVRGIEVGHIFKLGRKYSESMKCMFVGKDGKTHSMEMGCYGIGTTRIVQAVVEQSYDDDGIVWPWAIAPYQVVVTWAGKKDTDAIGAAGKLYEELLGDGYQALLDDRDMGLGARMKDAELIGIPFRILFGRGWKDGKLEIRCRKSGETADITPAEVKAWIEARKDA